LIGGNGFIAAFCVGLTVGNVSRAICEAIYEFAEAEGQLLTLLVFLVFGAVLAPVVFDGLNGRVIGFSILSLTVVRMLPAAVSLIGTRLRTDSRLFVGWFGPRGVASIVFAMVLLDEIKLPGRQEIFVAGMATVMMSVFCHGLSAYPAAIWYARRTQPTAEKPVAEHEPLTEMPFHR
jgi:NhaP-type Na+/H+ or K+/H+ antiporter